MQVTIVFLYKESPIDVDNYVKPLLDACKGILYADDGAVTDVDSHRRSLDGEFDLTRMPPELVSFLGGVTEVVYVDVRPARGLEDYLNDHVTRR